MVIHPRQEIREAVVALLKRAVVSTDGRVFPTREVPWRRTELPAIAVYALEESSQQKNLDGDLERDVIVAVQAVTQLGEGIDDALDALSLEIETVMAEDPTLGGTAMDSFLGGTEIAVDENTARPTGAIRLAYQIRYNTPASMT